MRRQEWTLLDIAKAVPARKSKKGKKEQPQRVPSPPQQRPPTPPSAQTNLTPAVTSTLPQYGRYEEEERRWQEETYQQKFASFAQPSMGFGELDKIDAKYNAALPSGTASATGRLSYDLPPVFQDPGQLNVPPATYSPLAATFGATSAPVATTTTPQLWRFGAQETGWPVSTIEQSAASGSPQPESYAEAPQEDVEVTLNPLPPRTAYVTPWLDETIAGDPVPVLEQQCSILSDRIATASSLNDENRRTLFSLQFQLIPSNYQQALHRQMQEIDEFDMSRNPRNLIFWANKRIKQLRQRGLHDAEIRNAILGMVATVMAEIEQIDWLVAANLVLSENIFRFLPG